MANELRALTTAMDRAELAGQAIPCKEKPELYTGDLIGMTSALSDQTAAEAAALCLACPVLAECRAYAQANVKQLYGVIAGQRIVISAKYGRHLAAIPQEIHA